MRDVVGKHLDLSEYKLFFFGSRVVGKGSARSDIDIGIEGPEKVPLSVMSRIEEEIHDIPVLYSIDIVDFRTVSSDFYKVAKSKVEFF